MNLMIDFILGTKIQLWNNRRLTFHVRDPLYKYDPIDGFTKTMMAKVLQNKLLNLNGIVSCVINTKHTIEIIKSDSYTNDELFLEIKKIFVKYLRVHNIW